MSERGDWIRVAGPAAILALCLLLAAPAAADAPAGASSATGLEVRFQPGYRYVQTSGFAGRVGELDALANSGGGDLLVQWSAPRNASRLDYRGWLLSRDEYAMTGKLRIGRLLRLDVDGRSLVRHLEKTLFGLNLSPDDIFRTDGISDAGLYGVRRSSWNGSARLTVPRTPLAVFARGGLQTRQGDSQLAFYDMGGDTTCGFCHSASRFQSVKYETQSYAGGVELMVAHAVLTYEHAGTIGRNRGEAPVDAYGSTLSLPGDELPAGVPNTLAGNYLHNFLPGHRSASDGIRVHAPLPLDLTLDGSVAGGHVTSTFAARRQNFVNGDAALAWRPANLLDLTLDYHEQSLINRFTPGYALFGDPSLHRSWAGLRAERSLNAQVELEAHYRYTRVSRTNADLWPQFYSPDNADPLRVVPLTTANAAGLDLAYRRGGRWRLRGGWEWTGTRDPGYVTEPKTAHRFTLGGWAAPHRAFDVAESFSAALQSDFPVIGRKNQLYLSTTSATIRPTSTWTLDLAYAIGAQRLRTDLLYGTDPPYPEALVPYDATDQSMAVAFRWEATKQLSWAAEVRYVWSLSEFKPSAAATPVDTLPLFLPVQFASAFSRVDIPQVVAGTTIAYRWPADIETSIRGAYASYRDQVHPEWTGYLRSLSVFVGRSW